MQAGLVTKKYRIMTAGLMMLANLVPKDNPNNIIHDNPIQETYDFIIAGGGTAGSVVAARLSEDLSSHVLLLEAGVAGTAYSEWPALTRFVYDTKTWDWRFKNVRDEGYCVGMKDKVCKLSRGRMLGGQSAFNRMMYVRGNRNDFDLWEKLGNPGWGYGHVLPYFIRSEDNLDHRLKHSPYHGVGGPLKVSSPQREQLSNLASLWLKSAIHNKFEIGDINGDKQSRFMLHQTMTAHGERWSTARAFLAPASHRHNLDIVVEAHVTRIIVDPDTKRAKGVVFYKDKKRHVAWARKEVIVSAGTFNSPQLLKLSGIGPCGELKKHGIFCKKNLPGVGENLQSHFGIGGIDFLVTKDGMQGPAKNLKNPVYMKKYLRKRTGPLASVMGLEGTGFISSSYNNVSYGQDWPDIQLLFYPQTISTDGYYESLIFGLSFKLWQTFYPNKDQPGFRIVPVNLRPRSRGRVALRSRNPWQHPDIFLNLFDDPHDLAILREGGQKAEAMGLSLPFVRAGASAMGERNRFCFIHPAGGPDWWDCRARVFPETMYQETSTCKMGPPSDPLAVVDNQLRVYGVSGLRVVDASIMPNIVSGDATAATVMIAERAADMIRAFWHGVHIGNASPGTFVEETVMDLGGHTSPASLGLGLGEQLSGAQQFVNLAAAAPQSANYNQEYVELAAAAPQSPSYNQEYVDSAAAAPQSPNYNQEYVEETEYTQETVAYSAPTTTATTTTEEATEATTTEVIQTTTQQPTEVTEIVTETTQQPTEVTEVVTETTQQPTEVTEIVTETTMAAYTVPVQQEVVTEAPYHQYTIQMGQITPMSGTIMVEPVGTAAPQEEYETEGSGEDVGGSSPETYDGSENNGYGTYGGISKEELFGGFPGAYDENYGRFLGPMRDYGGYPERVTASEEGYDPYPVPEPTAGEAHVAPLDTYPTSDYSAPLKTDPIADHSTTPATSSVSYEAPLQSKSEYEAPFPSDQAADYGVPFGLGADPGSDYRTNLATSSVSYGTPLQSEAAYRTPFPPGQTTDYANPASYGAPLQSQADYRTPFPPGQTTDYVNPVSYGAPLQSQADYRTPFPPDQTADYGAPLGLEAGPGSDYSSNLATNPASYGAPLQSQADYRTPFPPDQTADYGAPLGLGTKPESDYISPMQSIPRNEYDSSLTPVQTSSMDAFGDYSIRSTVAATNAPPPTTAVIEATSSEQPAAGAGRLQANIQRLKKEMKQAYDHSDTMPAVVVTERPTPRFDARAGATGEPRTYTSVYTDGLGDGMEDTFHSYAKRQTDSNDRKSDVVDKFVAEASVGHATVFHRVTSGKVDMNSGAVTSEVRKNRTSTSEGVRGVVESRRKVMQARQKSALAIDKANTSQSTRRGQANTDAETERGAIRNNGGAKAASRRNAGRSGRRQPNSTANSESPGSEMSKTRKVKAVTSPVKLTSQSRQNNGKAKAASRRNAGRSGRRQPNSAANSESPGSEMSKNRKVKAVTSPVKLTSQSRQNNGRAKAASRINAGRSGRRQPNSAANSESARSEMSKTRNAKAVTSPVKLTSQSRRRSGAAVARTNRARIRTWDMSIVTRVPKVQSERKVDQRRTNSPTTRKTSSRQPQSTVRGRLLRKKEAEVTVTFGSKRVHADRIDEGSVASPKNVRHTSSKAKVRTDDDDNMREVAIDASASDPGTWGMKN